MKEMKEAKDTKGFINRLLLIQYLIISLGAGLLFWTEKKLPYIKTDKFESAHFYEKKLMDNSIKKIELFFGSANKSFLVGESREIERKPGLHQQIRQIIVELSKISNTNHLSEISPITKLQHIFIDKSGIGYLNFEPIQKKIGSTWSETVFIYSMVNTIIKNFPQIKQIRFLWAGQEMRTLFGHLDMQSAFSFEDSLIDQNENQIINGKEFEE